MASVPSTIKSFEIPTIVYTLDSPISSKIFNFNKFTTNFNVSEFVKDKTVLPCNCSSSSFTDKHHGHIVSGDLRIVQNNKLRKLFTRGPKYRESKQIDWKKARIKILDGVKECATKFCSDNKLHKNVLSDWVGTIGLILDQRIELLNTNRPINRVAEVLKNKTCKDSLSKLQENFVIAPIDKATGNVAFICKRFYATVLIRELGLVNEVGSKTYDGKIRKNSADIVKKNVKDLKKEFDIDVSSDNSCLPHIYWLPKMHKNPIKFRFIIAAPKCSIKPLSKAVTSVFKLFYNQIEHYNLKSYFYSSIKTFWVIQNNQPVIDSLNKINLKGKADCISTFDFSTLYTTIPHDKLLDVMNELTDFCFTGGTHKLISVTSSGARWVTRKSKVGLTFDKNSFKDAIKYLMENCFFTLGEKLFRQIIGIPMGSDPAPFMANLFLYFYESKWIRNVKKSNIQRARRFCNTFRFIDDLFAINDHGEFERSFREIYPPELELKKEHSGDVVSFLDLSIRKEDRKFSFGLYDKRDGFPFAIVRMPFSTSNIPSQMFYSCIGAEILRIGRTSSVITNFINPSKSFLCRMFKQGAEFDKVRRTLLKVYGRHQIMNRFFHSAKEFVDSLLG